MTTRILAGCVVLALANGCAAPSPKVEKGGDFRSEYTAEQLATCEVPIKSGLVLSPRERCWLARLKERCDPNDQCLAACIAQGAGRNIGGQCWHLCFAYTDKVWTEPDNWAECGSLSRDVEGTV